MTSKPPINLSNVTGCVTELESVANGLASLDFMFHKAVNLLSDAEETWSAYESQAHDAVRDELRKAATAGEVKAAVAEWTRKNAPARKAWDELREARRYKEKVEHFVRSMEKRGSFAQSAQKGHDAIRQGGGNEAPGPTPGLRRVS